jgi:hypothetical protein
MATKHETQADIDGSALLKSVTVTWKLDRRLIKLDKRVLFVDPRLLTRSINIKLIL